MTEAKLKEVGWREYVALPSLCVKKMKAKIDTGAFTSAIHVSHIEKVPGTKMIRFRIHPNEKSVSPTIVAQAKVVEYRNVRSSNGHMTRRPVIRTKVRLGKRTFTTEFTLVNREKMEYRMLLGRKALSGRFVVDCSKSYKRPLQKSTLANTN